MKYQIQQRETGIVINDCPTLLEAQSLLEAFEWQDKVNNEFVPNFYAIAEVETNDYDTEQFVAIMYTLPRNESEAMAMYQALDYASQSEFIDWLSTTYYYEQFDNDDAESLIEVIDLFKSQPKNETQHRMAMILDDLSVIKTFIYNKGLHEVFKESTGMADECFTHIHNIEIACDLNDKECLNWRVFRD